MLKERLNCLLRRCLIAFPFSGRASGRRRGERFRGGQHQQQQQQRRGHQPLCDLEAFFGPKQHDTSSGCGCCCCCCCGCRGCRRVQRDGRRCRRRWTTSRSSRRRGKTSLCNRCPEGTLCDGAAKKLPTSCMCRRCKAAAPESLSFLHRKISATLYVLRVHVQLMMKLRS